MVEREELSTKHKDGPFLGDSTCVCTRAHVEKFVIGDEKWRAQGSAARNLVASRQKNLNFGGEGSPRSIVRCRRD